MKKGLFLKSCFAMFLATQLIVFTGCGGHGGGGGEVVGGSGNGGSGVSATTVEGVKMAVAPILANTSEILGGGVGSSMRGNAISANDEFTESVDTIKKQLARVADLNTLVGAMHTVTPGTGNINGGMFIKNTEGAVVDVASYSNGIYEYSQYQIIPIGDYYMGVNQDNYKLVSNIKIDGCVATLDENKNLTSLKVNDNAKFTGSADVIEQDGWNGRIKCSVKFEATIKKGISIKANTTWTPLATPLRYPKFMNGNLAEGTSNEFYSSVYGDTWGIATYTYLGKETWEYTLDDNLEFEVSKISYQSATNQEEKYEGTATFVIKGISGTFKNTKYHIKGKNVIHKWEYDEKTGECIGETVEETEGFGVATFYGFVENFDGLNINKPQITVKATSTGKGLELAKAVVNLNEVKKYPSSTELIRDGYKIFDVGTADATLEINNNNKAKILVPINGKEYDLMNEFKTATVKVEKLAFKKDWNKDDYVTKPFENALVTVSIKGDKTDASINAKISAKTLDATVINKGNNKWAEYSEDATKYTFSNMVINATGVNYLQSGLRGNDRLNAMLSNATINVKADDSVSKKTLTRVYNYIDGNLVENKEKRIVEDTKESDKPVTPVVVPEITIPSDLENIKTGASLTQFVPATISDFANSIVGSKDITSGLGTGTKMKVGTKDGKRVGVCETSNNGVKINTQLVATSNVIYVISYCSIGNNSFTIAFCIESKKFKGKVFKGKRVDVSYDSTGEEANIYGDGSAAKYVDASGETTLSVY